MLDSNTIKILLLILGVALVLFAFFYILMKLTASVSKANANKQKANTEKPAKVKKEKKVKTAKKQKQKKEKKTNQVEKAPEEVVQGPSADYVSPLILDRAKYEIALQERLERERKERFNRQAAETARIEALKNKEFQSHAGYITTLQRFSKKEELEKQLSENGKVDKELLGVYLNEKGTTISDEFNNMSPELKAVILSDLMNRKY